MLTEAAFDPKGTTKNAISCIPLLRMSNTDKSIYCVWWLNFLSLRGKMEAELNGIMNYDHESHSSSQWGKLSYFTAAEMKLRDSYLPNEITDELYLHSSLSDQCHSPFNSIYWYILLPKICLKKPPQILNYDISLEEAHYLLTWRDKGKILRLYSW